MEIKGIKPDAIAILDGEEYIVRVICRTPRTVSAVIERDSRLSVVDVNRLKLKAIPVANKILTHKGEIIE